MPPEENPGDPIESRPGIFVVGSSNVGKRTLLYRLMAGLDFDDGLDSFSDVSVYGWKISTKYYTADVSLWMSHLHEGLDIGSLPVYDRLQALVMVFDISDLNSLKALQDWVSKNDIGKFEILLCIGNKVDGLPGHPVHAEYRRRLRKIDDDSSGYFGGLMEGGISETEGTSLLSGEEPSSDIKRSCLEWCSSHNIEYIEACASNAEFDKCLSVDGDLQGVERLVGALSSHMWPGMVLKAGNKITEPSLTEKQDSSEEEKESEYEFDYEILSAGSAEQWNDTEWVSGTEPGTSSQVKESVVEMSIKCDEGNGTIHDGMGHQVLDLERASGEKTDDASRLPAEDSHENLFLEKGGKSVDLEDLEQLMSEIGNIHENLRFMPDFQRREMAANLVVKMASMFGGNSDEEE